MIGQSLVHWIETLGVGVADKTDKV